MFHLDHPLLQIYRLLSETSDISAALPKILDLMIQGSHAERGQIELYDEKGETLFLQARKNGVDIEDRRRVKSAERFSRGCEKTVRSCSALMLGRMSAFAIPPRFGATIFYLWSARPCATRQVFSGFCISTITIAKCCLMSEQKICWASLLAGGTFAEKS